jgi:hypothetical protein
VCDEAAMPLARSGLAVSVLFPELFALRTAL